MSSLHSHRALHEQEKLRGVFLWYLIIFFSKLWRKVMIGGNVYLNSKLEVSGMSFRQKGPAVSLQQAVVPQPQLRPENRARGQLPWSYTSAQLACQLPGPQCGENP